MDFSKALNKVNYMYILLTHKLDMIIYGIRGKTNQWIKNFLLNQSQSVVVEGRASSNIPVDSGVPQGSVLGPSLFLFYINDLPEGITSNVRLFADDTIMYITVSNNNDATTLQHDLDKLANWESKWHMEFHPAKCNALTITKTRIPIRHNYILNGHTLEHVTSVKYLGCTITSDLKWSQHIGNICNKAINTISFLERNQNISNTKIKEKVYMSLVRPIIE